MFWIVGLIFGGRLGIDWGDVSKNVARCRGVMVTERTATPLLKKKVIVPTRGTRECSAREG
jgi:hypothetical protein